MLEAVYFLTGLAHSYFVKNSIIAIRQVLRSSSARVTVSRSASTVLLDRGLS